MVGVAATNGVGAVSLTGSCVGEVSVVGVPVSAPGTIGVDVASPPQAARVNNMTVGARTLQYLALSLFAEHKLTTASPRSMMCGRRLSEGTV